MWNYYHERQNRHEKVNTESEEPDMKKNLFSALILLLCLCLCAGLCFAESEDLPVIECEKISGSFQWMGRELTVKNVRLNEESKAIEVCYLAPEGDPIPTAEMATENLKLITLKEPSGEIILPSGYSYWGVTFDAATMKFGDAETQEGFVLTYRLPDGISPEELELAPEQPPAE